jgi:site-specific DNA recombinase
MRDVVERGVLPWPELPLGYRRGDDGILVVVPDEARATAEAFQLRATGASIRQVQALLKRHGVDKSFSVTQRLLASRVVLGEIHFGALVNTEAHEPIVDRAVWDAVQAVKVPRGPRPTSDRLLARLGVLRCGGCGARMTVGSTTKRGYRRAIYRCPGTSDCTNRAAISAAVAEQVVTDRVRVELANVQGRASAQRNIWDAEAKLANANAALAGAIEALSGFENVPATRSRLEQLRQDVETAEAHFEQVGGPRSTVTIDGNADWEKLLPDEKRALIRALVSRATVTPGAGKRERGVAVGTYNSADRIAVELFV